MGFIINAWLERANPLIQILSAHTGDVLLSLDTKAVTSRLAKGDITIAELQQQHNLTLALDIYAGLFAVNYPGTD
jgi:hypothetical protein